MSYPKNIVQFRPRKGINVDLPPSEITPEEYSAGRNVHFREGFAQRSAGEKQVYPGLLTNLRNIINLIDNTGNNFWVYTGENKISAVVGVVHSDITPLVGLTTRDDPNTYTTSLLNNVLIWNNGDDPPFFWDSVATSPLIELPGWIAGDRAEAMRPFTNHLFAMDMTESVAGRLPNKIKWSDAAEPGTVPAGWTPTAAGDAGDVELADDPGPVIDALALRGSFILYKAHSTYICDFVGGQFVFSFRKLFHTSGVLARNCIAEYNGRHYVLTDDDIVVHDGNTISSLLDNRARRAVFANLDQSNFQSSFVINYEKRKELWFCLPSAGNFFADLAVIYNLQEDAWSTRDLVEVAHGAIGIVSDTTFSDAWDAAPDPWDNTVRRWDEQLGNESEQSIVLASTDETVATDSRLLEADRPSDFDGLPINGLLQKIDMHFDEPDRVKLVKRCYPKINANNGTELFIRLGGSDVPGGAIQWSPPFRFVKGSIERVDAFAQGKYISFELSSNGLNPWQLMGFDLEVEIRGYH